MYTDVLKLLRESGMRQSLSLDRRELLRKAADAIEEMGKSLDVLADANNKLRAQIPEWIPVEERLPDYSGRFLVVSEVDEEGFAKGIKTIDFARRWSDRTWEMSGVSIKSKVTHWMPLPELPEEGADG